MLRIILTILSIKLFIVPFEVVPSRVYVLLYSLRPGTEALGEVLFLEPL